MKDRNKLLSILLALIITASSMPFFSFAEDLQTEAGTAEYTEEEMQDENDEIDDTNEINEENKENEDAGEEVPEESPDAMTDKDEEAEAKAVMTEESEEKDNGNDKGNDECIREEPEKAEEKEMQSNEPAAEKSGTEQPAADKKAILANSKSSEEVMQEKATVLRASASLPTDVVEIQYDQSDTYETFYGHETSHYTETDTYNTRKRTITKVKLRNGKIYDLKDSELTQSYFYCMEPGTKTPPVNTWIDVESELSEDTAGKKAILRKATYYLMGAPGYRKVTKERWAQAYKDDGGKSSIFAMFHGLITYLYDSSNSLVVSLDDTKQVSEYDKKWIKKWAKDLKNLDDPPDDFTVVILDTGKKYQTLIGAVYFEPEFGYATVKKVSGNTSITG